MRIPVQNTIDTGTGQGIWMIVGRQRVNGTSDTTHQPKPILWKLIWGALLVKHLWTLIHARHVWLWRGWLVSLLDE